VFARRPSAEGEAGGREESQLITQSPARPKEGEEDFSSFLSPISLVETITMSVCMLFTSHYRNANNTNNYRNANNTNNDM